MREVPGHPSFFLLSFTLSIGDFTKLLNPLFMAAPFKGSAEECIDAGFSQGGAA
jgi:hypothetical protein